MSGSLTSIYDNVSYALLLHGRAITQLQEQASTGNRLNRGSDAPSDAYRIMGLESQDHSLASYQENVTELMGNLEISSTVITDMASELADTRTLLTQIVGGVHDAEGQKRIADKLNNTLEQLVSLANTKHANQYLFGGNDTGTAPYLVTREGGMISQVTYRGSDEARRVDVAPGLDIEGYHVGDAIFRTDDRGDPIFLGETGAAAGTGTSNVRGDVWLTVDYDGSNYRVSIDDGATFVTVPPGGDVFGTLISLRDILLNKRSLPNSEVLDYVDQAVAAVEEVRNLLVQADVSTGSKIAFLNTLKQNLENMQFNTQDETTRLQEADVAQISIDLSRREVLYQMSLSVAGRLMSTSLLDFIQ
jgi:flagellar hook-associated protein 3